MANPTPAEVPAIPRKTTIKVRHTKLKKEKTITFGLCNHFHMKETCLSE
jgi:hypothetical protein